MTARTNSDLVPRGVSTASASGRVQRLDYVESRRLESRLDAIKRAGTDVAAVPTSRGDAAQAIASIERLARW